MANFQNKIFAGSALYEKIKSESGRMYREKLYFAGIQIIKDEYAEPMSMYTRDPNLVEVIEGMKNEPKL